MFYEQTNNNVDHSSSNIDGKIYVSCQLFRPR